MRGQFESNPFWGSLPQFGRFGAAFGTEVDHADAAASLITDLGTVYGYTQSVGFDLFGRSLEKLVSVSAGIASAVFTAGAGQPAHFDSGCGSAPGKARLLPTTLLAAV